ncbi:MAG: diguanylate cyclase [Clostridia bacterium]|nr:diguanylate cyclase [Clostridia bacterium]
MSLRRKTMAVVGLTLTCLIIIIYILSQTVMLKSFGELESRAHVQNVETVTGALSNTISSYNEKACDWAIWDDAYQFVQDGNKDFIDTNLNVETFIGLRVNFMLFVNEAGNIVYGKGIDLKSKKEIPIPQDLKKNISPGNLLLKHKDSRDIISGLIMLSENPAMVVSHPIVNSEREGPIKGSLIIVRFFDLDEVVRLSAITHMTLNIYRMDNRQHWGQIERISTSITEKKPIVIQPIDEGNIAGYTLLKDIHQRPAIMLRVDWPRFIYSYGTGTSWNLVGIILVVGIVFGIVINILLEKLVLMRMGYLSRRVDEISKSNDFSDRLSIKGKDELSSLAGAVNRLLEAQESRIQELEERTNELEEARSFIESVFNLVGNGIGVIDMQGNILTCNKVCADMYGYSIEEAINGNIKNLYKYVGEDYHLEAYAEQLMKNEVLTLEFESHRRDGAKFPLESKATLLKDKSGNPSAVVFTIADITQRKNAEKVLRESEERFRSIFEQSPIGISIYNAEGGMLHQNKACADIFGVSQEQVVNNFNFFKYTHYISPENKIRSIKNGVYTSEVEFNFDTLRSVGLQTTKSGKAYLHCTVTPLGTQGGTLSGYLIQVQDITERKTAEKEITYLSFHDKLTGIHNRAYFEQELERLDSESDLPVSIIMGDLNGLKIVNDVFGHSEGDKLLVRMADIIKTSCRKKDIVARLGGDEFAIILPKTPEKIALNICQRIRNACKRSEADPIRPSIALGVSSKENLSQEIVNVIKEAEDRMYRHKLLEDKSARSSIIALFEKTLFAKSYETEEHAQRMRLLAVKVGHAVGLPDSKMDELTLLAALHDIGKIGIPDSILSKPGPLNDLEWEEMKKHPEIGYRIAKSTPELAPIADAILTHHERWDGLGYPQGLKGEEIQMISRIIAIVDTYDVMTHKRAYKEPASYQEALNEIKRCAGTQFDPDLVNVFIEVVNREHEQGCIA